MWARNWSRQTDWLEYHNQRFTHPCGQNTNTYKNQTQTILVVAVWNVRTLQDQPNNTDNDRPHRRTALFAKELSRFRVAEEGRLLEDQLGYTFFWKGKGKEKPRIHGVGFAVKNELVKKHCLCPVAISERLTILRVPLEKKNFLTLMSVYAPTLTADENEKEAFHQQLSYQISRVPAGDRLIILGKLQCKR